ncbi:hypothetical protein [Streptomyces venezuelae]|uniref:hypothetical protein n=1 Tax=Streptomyces venezuelae TaxID=54571 RepID=UPI003413F87A
MPAEGSAAGSCREAAFEPRGDTAVLRAWPQERISPATLDGATMNRSADMGKQPKNRSSRKAKQDRQARARLGRQKQQAEAASEAFDEAFKAGYFTAAGPGGESVRLTLDDIRQALNTELAGDGEPPVEGEDELLDFLVEDLEHGDLLPRADGRWEVRPAYLGAG